MTTILTQGDGDPTAAARMTAAHEKAEDARRAENAFSFRNVTIISTGTIQQAYISPLTGLLVDKEQYDKQQRQFQEYINMVTGSVGGIKNVGKIVIGENMAERVIPYAESIGAKYYKPILKKSRKLDG